MKLTLISNIFAPHARGGYELGCEAIARRLLALGHEVTILTSQVAGALHKTAEPVGLDIRRIFAPVFEYEEDLFQILARSVCWHRRAASAFGGVIPGNVTALENYFSEHSTDVIWVFNPLGIGPVGIMEVVANQNAKCLIHLMDHIDDAVSGQQRFHNYAARWRRNKQRLTAISCSSKIRQTNERLGPYRAHHLIYNGFSVEEIPRNPADERNGVFRFLYFGQLSREKGVPQVVKAFSALVKRQKAVKCNLDVIGKGSSAFESELRQLIKTEEISDRVNCLGFMPKQELVSRLAHYDAAVMLLNPVEPFGYAPLEAACGGLPVISTAGTGIAETFPEKYPLLVANRDDIAEAVRKMEWCIAHRSGLRSLASDLWRGLSAHCDLDRVTMPAYLKAIEQCPVNSARLDLRPLLAASATVEFYSQLY